MTAQAIRKTISLLIPIRLVFEYHFIRKAGPGQLVLNRFFKLFRRDSGFDFSLHHTSQIICPGRVKYQKDMNTLLSLAVSGHCYIQANNGIVLGRNCLIAPGVKIVSSNHRQSVDRSFEETGPIVIGDDVWIGTNAVILPNVKIGDRCIIGAGSVVTKSFELPNRLIAGNPAKIIKVIE